MADDAGDVAGPRPAPLFFPLLAAAMVWCTAAATRQGPVLGGLSGPPGPPKTGRGREEGRTRPASLGLPTSYQITIISMLHATSALRRSHNSWNQSSSSYGALRLRLSTISAWVGRTRCFAEALSKCSRLQDCSRFPWRMGEKGERAPGVTDVTTEQVAFIWVCLQISLSQCLCVALDLLYSPESTVLSG